jgi:hypothetical protein
LLKASYCFTSVADVGQQKLQFPTTNSESLREQASREIPNSNIQKASARFDVEAWLFQFLWSPFDCRSGQALDAGAWSFISIRSSSGSHHDRLSSILRSVPKIILDILVGIHTLKV